LSKRSFALPAPITAARRPVSSWKPDGSYFHLRHGQRPQVVRAGLDAAQCGHKKTYNFFLSHLHWDHIMGFPFFAPAFDPEATIRIHAAHADAEQALRRQQEEISFPVPFDWLRANFEFVQLTPGEGYEIDGVKVGTKLQQYSMPVTVIVSPTPKDGQSSTVPTASNKLDKMDADGLHRILPDADLVIFDTMYSLAESVSMKEIGHSSNMSPSICAMRRRPRRLVCLHHEPTYDDEDIQRMYEETSAMKS
jgi:phosphoribosyl 1,2-cyclic phosphodiesterase